MIDAQSPRWMRDEDAPACCNLACGAPFGVLRRRHHCRKCGSIFCDSCCPDASPSRMCVSCSADHVRPVVQHATLSAFTSGSLRGLLSRTMSAGSNPSPRDEGKEPVESYYCQICFGNNDVLDAVKLAACGHHFCVDCMRGYLESKINDGQTHPRCFHVESDKSCDRMIDKADVQRVVPAETMAKFERFLRNEKDSNNRDCPKCDAGNTGDPLSPAMRCGACSHAFCYAHGDAHTDSQVGLALNFYL